MAAEQIDSLLSTVTHGVLSGWLTPALRAALEGVDRYALGVGLPGPALALEALRYAQPREVKVVVLGQDPYHASLDASDGLNWRAVKANGLAFGLSREWVIEHKTSVLLTSSFGNVVREAERARTLPFQPDEFDLVRWARQGVLLLNSRALSVAPGRPLSHADVGWQAVVAEVLRLVASAPVWLLWGAEARTVGLAAMGPESVALVASHPSKYSAKSGPNPFVGCDHFRRANEALARAGVRPVRW